MADVRALAYEVAKYMWDNGLFGGNTINSHELLVKSGLSREDFYAAHDYLIQHRYVSANYDFRSLSPEGGMFVQAGLRQNAESEAETMPHVTTDRGEVTGGPRKVFIIHGRDLDARDEMVKFLKSLGLSHLDFEEVADEMGGIPFIADIVLKGINAADAVIALFTPDELAALYDPQTGDYKGAEGSGSRWQARPNVIFEAGVAFGTAKSKTILVTLGTNVALFSDASGIHFIDLASRNGKKSLRKRLAGIVGGLGAAPDNWEEPQVSGDFQRCLRQRWPHFDELAELEARLSATNIDDTPSLLRIVRSVVLNRENYDWGRQVTSEPFMNSVSELFGEKVAEDAYWWLLVYGFLRFAEAHPWWDGKPTWKNSARFSVIAERGLKLIAKLDMFSVRVRPS